MWNNLNTKNAPEGEIVKTISDDGFEAELMYKNGIWWTTLGLPAIYKPLFWKRMGT